MKTEIELADPKGLFDYRFRCPRCGSSFFSTVGSTEAGLHGPIETWIGKCKGYFIGTRRITKYSGCTFTWSRADDKRYFTSAKRIFS